VLKDCERKQNSKDSKYETLADAISERVRDAVGETHWARARQIQKQLELKRERDGNGRRGPRFSAAGRSSISRPGRIGYLTISKTSFIFFVHPLQGVNESFYISGKIEI